MFVAIYNLYYVDSDLTRGKEVGKRGAGKNQF